MARPKSWFTPKEFSTARKQAKTRGHKLWKYSRPTRDGKPENGYYVGSSLPVRLSSARVESKL